MARRAGIVLLLGALVVAGAALFSVTEKEAEAGFTSDSTKDLIAFVKAPGPFNRKLMALEEIRLRTESGIEAELEKLARVKEVKVAVMAASALGRKGTAAAKTSLKKLLEDSSVGTSVRLGALSAIAFGWKDSGDQSYLAAKTRADTKLAAHYLRLKSAVYGK